jgi:hypothetical protein
MPIRRQIDQENQITTFIAAGKISLKDITAALESYFSGEITQNILWDFRHSVPSEVFLPRKIKEIIDFAKGKMGVRNYGKTAIVTSTGVGFGLAKAYEAFAALKRVQYPIKAFDSIDEALTWINSERA